jgi:hypothetical protein
MGDLLAIQNFDRRRMGSCSLERLWNRYIRETEVQFL